MFHLGDADGQLLAFDKFADGFLGGFHDGFVLVHFVVCQCESWQGYEHVAGSALEPRVACQHVVFVLAVYDELMCAVDQGVVEVVSRRADAHFEVCQVGQCAGVDFFQAGSEDDAFAFLCYLKLGKPIVLNDEISVLHISHPINSSNLQQLEDNKILLQKLFEQHGCKHFHISRVLFSSDKPIVDYK